MIQHKRRRPWSGQNEGVCARCGREQAKKRMVAVFVKELPYLNPATLCHVCHDCLPGLLDYLDVGMPERQ